MPHPAVSTPKQSDFLAVPESPVVYWLRPKFFELLDQKQGVSDFATVKQGLATTDSIRLTRYFWEVEQSGTQKAPQWFWYAKGGRYQKWYGLNSTVVDWHLDGVRIKQQVVEKYLYLKGGFEWVAKNIEYYLAEGITYTQVARGNLGFRKLRGEIFGHTSNSVFVRNISEDNMLAILNSRIATYFVRALSQKLTIEAGHVSLIPIEIPNLQYIVKQSVNFKRALVATDPTERSFAGVVTAQRSMEAIAAVLHTLEGINERVVFAAYGVAGADMQAVLDETGVPAGFYPLLTGYDALPALPAYPNLPPLPQEVLDHLASHERITPSPAQLGRITMRLRVLYEAGIGAKQNEEVAEAAEEAEGGEEEAAVSGAHIPIPTETFLEELSVKMQLHPISVYWLLEELRSEGARCKPEERRLLEDRLSVIVLRLLGHRWPKQIEAGEPVPSWADEDGIIPISGGTGQQTLHERVRARLRDEDGDLGAQRAEALVQELTGQSLEEWLRREFFKRHVRQFKYRPIAWQLVSDPAAAVADVRAKKRLGGRRQPAFECMVYYHSCGGDVLARIRTQYVEPLLRGARQQLEQANRTNDENTIVQATMRIQELEDFNRKLQQVAERGFTSPEDKLLHDEPLDRWSGDGYGAPVSRDDLQRQEQAWRVDLNDGVRVNIAPVQLARLLVSDVLKAVDAKKAIADRARWRSDERRWVRTGKLPRPGWHDERVPESPEWTRLAPQREAERAKLAEKRAKLAEPS